MSVEMIYKNYEAFYSMVLATAIMSNDHTPKMKADGKRIVEFIGNAYGLDKEIIDESKSIILEDLSVLGLSKDQMASYGRRCTGDECTDEEILLDIKADAIAEIGRIANNNGKGRTEITPTWFDYSHYVVYHPSIRFEKINMTSATGNIVATRQIGLLRALGIGCEVDYEAAERRLLQCALWGDIPSMRLLAYVYQLDKKKDRACLFAEIADLSNKYLRSGVTVLPAEEKKAHSEEACVYYVYISTIRQDVVYAHGVYDIDFSFLEALASDKLDYFDRMNYINKYANKEWKNVTNSSERPVKALGFN